MEKTFRGGRCRTTLAGWTNGEVRTVGIAKTTAKALAQKNLFKPRKRREGEELFSRGRKGGEKRQPLIFSSEEEVGLVRVGGGYQGIVGRGKNLKGRPREKKWDQSAGGGIKSPQPGRVSRRDPNNAVKGMGIFLRSKRGEGGFDKSQPPPYLPEPKPHRQWNFLSRKGERKTRGY